MIGIVGGSGSGKTTLARSVCANLGAEHAVRIEHDAYYHDLSHMEPPERAVVNFDHPRALDNARLGDDLDALRAGRAVPELRYCFATHTRKDVVSLIDPHPVVVVEGILLFSVDVLRPRFDLRVFVDTPPDMRFLRRLRRDVAERGRTVESVCSQYLDTVRPMHEEFVEPAKEVADLVVSGMRPIETTTREVAAEIARRRERATRARPSS